MHIKDWKVVDTKIKTLIDGTHEKLQVKFRNNLIKHQKLVLTSNLQVVADFDFTLTKFHINGSRSPSCHGNIDFIATIPKQIRSISLRCDRKLFPDATNVQTKEQRAF